jgi:23S rRNA pseudouridine1911/1915/1917 synthase
LTDATPEASSFRGPVPALLDGVRVDRAVALLTGHSRALAATLVREGRVRVEGRVVRGGAPLRGGQVIEIEDPGVAVDLPSPDGTVEFGVAYEDRDLVVVDKPAGLVVHPGAGRPDGTLVNGLLARYPDLGELARSASSSPERPGIVQRLDKGTSGLMVVARTERAREDLVRQLSQRSVERRYVALVAGRVAEERGVVDAPIGRSLRAPSRMSVTGGGRTARTSYRALERFDAPEPATLLELSLETGRTHQIRVHLAAIGHPVVGDETYAPQGPRHSSQAVLDGGRLFLHAGRLGLRHPVSAQWMCWDSALPDDLERVLSACRRAQPPA